MPSKTCHLLGKSCDRQHKHEDKVYVLAQQRATGRSHFGW
jgi:hypothetical protein